MFFKWLINAVVCPRLRPTYQGFGRIEHLSVSRINGICIWLMRHFVSSLGREMNKAPEEGAGKDHDETDVKNQTPLTSSSEKKKLDIQGKKKKKGKKKRKETKESNDDPKTTSKFPNYFLAVKIASPRIRGSLKAVQDCIVQHDERLKQALVNVSTAHLTLFIMYLPDENAVKEASGLLESCKQELDNILSGSPLCLNMASLGHFRNEVLFANVTPGQDADKLEQMADVLGKKFETFQSSNKFVYKPHLTLMKLSKVRKRKNKIRKIDRKYYRNLENLTFGKEIVNNVQLLSMQKKKDTEGYYHCDCEVPLAESYFQKDDQDVECIDDDVSRYSEFLTSYSTMSAYCQILNGKQNVVGELPNDNEKESRSHDVHEDVSMQTEENLDKTKSDESTEEQNE